MTEKKEPLLKWILENPWLLLALGVLVPTISYTLWGWLEVWRLAPAILP